MVACLLLTLDSRWEAENGQGLFVPMSVQGSP